MGLPHLISTNNSFFIKIAMELDNARGCTQRRKIKLFILRNAVYLGYLAQQVHMRIIFYFKLNYISIFAKKTIDYGGSTK